MRRSTGCRRNPNISALGGWLLICGSTSFSSICCFQYVVTSQHVSEIRQREVWKTEFSSSSTMQCWPNYPRVLFLSNECCRCYKIISQFPPPPSASNAFYNLYFPVAINDKKQVKFNKIKNLTNLIFILVFL